MDEKELSNRQTRVMPQKEIHEKSEPEQNKSDKGVLPIRDLYYRFRRSDDEEEPEQNLERKHKPEEPPHDHQEDHQQEPPPALRERRRPLVRTREDEEEEGESTQTEKTITVENGTQEEWRHDEDVVDILIVKKDGETQTTVFQTDKSVETRPDMRDEEVQSSTVRENRTTQAIPETRDMGTGEWLAFQRSIGVGNHLETAEKGLGEDLKAEDKAIQFHPEQEDKSIQEEPEKESKGVGSYPASFHDKSVQVNPDAKDKSVQEVREHLSMGVGTDEKEMRDQSLQVFPSLQDKDIQKDISMADKSVQEQRKGLSLSSIVRKENMPSDNEDSLSLEYSPSPHKIPRSLSDSVHSEEGILKHMETIKSQYVSSSNDIEFEDSYVQEHSMRSIQKGIKLEDIPMDESIYSSHNQFPSKVEESEIIEEDKPVISFQSNSKKEESQEFEVVKKPVVSRNSSFSIVDKEKE